MLKKLNAKWFTRPVQMSVFVLTELILTYDSYRHRTHPAQVDAHVVLAVILAIIWWRAARTNTPEAYDSVDWISYMSVTGLFLIPDFFP